MKDQIENRLSNLKAEYSQGEKIIADLSEKRERTVYSMLRISGAIQVLEEMLAEEERAQAENILTEDIETEAVEVEQQ